MQRLIFASVFGLVALLSQTAAAQSSASPAVFFVEPADGATVTSPFVVKFGLTGMEVKPAEDMTPNSGHHHLLINSESIKAGNTVPNDEKHLHFGKGQTETTVTLPPGQYTLTLQFANGAHSSYGPAMSKTIRVTVK